MSGAHPWRCPAVLSLLAAATGLPTHHAGAQIPIPEKYRAEAERLNGPLPTYYSAPSPGDPGADAAAYARAARRAADSIAAITPQILPVMEGTVEVPRGTFQLKGFEVPQDSHCTLDGHSEGDRDFEVLVVPSPGMAAWRADAQAGNPVWRSGLTKAASLAVALPGPGNYDLVVSNRAAWFLARTIATKIQLSCTRDWPPPS